MKRVLGEGWALPAPDELNLPFFTTGALMLQQCTRCANIQHPPEDVCISCQCLELQPFRSAGKGRIESVAIVRHAVHPLLKDQIPYAIVLVSVDDAPGLVITGNVAGTDPDAIRIGDQVSVVFEEVLDPQNGLLLKIPQWEITA